MYGGCKGAQRRMILLKNTGSELFESAYFILNENAAVQRAGEDDMIREANRIVSSNMMVSGRGIMPAALRESRKKKDMRLKCFLWFSAGSLAGSGLMLLAQWIF